MIAPLLAEENQGGYPTFNFGQPGKGSRNPESPIEEIGAILNHVRSQQDSNRVQCCINEMMDIVHAKLQQPLANKICAEKGNG